MSGDSLTDKLVSVVCQGVTCRVVLWAFANLIRSLHMAPSARQTITKGGKAALLV